MSDYSSTIETPLVPAVYTAITAIIADLAREGIGKTKKNEQQGYRFRGIDQFFNALAPLLAQHKLCVLPRCLSREMHERQNQKGTTLFYVTVAVEFDFVSSIDGSMHKVGPFYGEAMDSGDKATNKAMSAAFKYAVMESFCVPVEGQQLDADAESPEPISDEAVAARQVLEAAAKEGKDKLRAAWQVMPADVRTALKGDLDGWKAVAATADAAKQAGVE